MNEEAMRKHYERTPKETLINILIASREEVEKLQKRNKEYKREIERYINEEYIYDELGMKIFDASRLQDKLQELKGDGSNGN